MIPANNRIYLASPNGFVGPHKWYTEEIKAALVELGYEVLDPWAEDYSAYFMDAQAIKDFDKRIIYHRALAHIIGSRNHELIRRAGTVLGVLEGPEIDSGTVSELAFAAGQGVPVYGIRCDFRDTGDMLGVPINLQVLYWINLRGGTLFRSIVDLKTKLPRAPKEQPWATSP